MNLVAFLILAKYFIYQVQNFGLSLHNEYFDVVNHKSFTRESVKMRRICWTTKTCSELLINLVAIVSWCFSLCELFWFEMLRWFPTCDALLWMVMAWATLSGIKNSTYYNTLRVISPYPLLKHKTCLCTFRSWFQGDEMGSADAHHQLDDVSTLLQISCSPTTNKLHPSPSYYSSSHHLIIINLRHHGNWFPKHEA